MPTHYSLSYLVLFLLHTCKTMKNTFYFLIILLFGTHTASGQTKATTVDGKQVVLYENGTWKYEDTTVNLFPIQGLELPKQVGKDAIVTHTAYTLCYNELHEQANWVAYELTATETVSIYERTDKFLEDPEIKTGSATAQDYAGYGYDRGHLAPAADMGWSAQSMVESFYYSNMSPQDPSFNRGIWKKCEELVRNWAVDFDKIYVATGPILTAGLSNIGSNKVSIPKYYYKVILDYSAPQGSAIGFVMPNKGSSAPLQQYAVSIDSVEKLTGIDFYAALPDALESSIEKTVDLQHWDWDVQKSSHSASTSTGSSVQCKGTTKKGETCKNKTLNSSGYCYLHENQQPGAAASPSAVTAPAAPKSSSSVECSATTKAGNQCKNRTTSPSGRCHVH